MAHQIDVFVVEAWRTAGDCSRGRGVRPVSSPPSGGSAAERALGGDRPGTRISVLKYTDGAHYYIQHAYCTD